MKNSQIHASEVKTLSETVLGAPVSGVNLRGQTLGEQLGSRPHMLVFLRHFGCVFCREMVKDIKKIVESDASFPEVMFFYQGTPEQGTSFFNSFYPQAVAVADLPKYFYRHFGLQKGKFKQMFSPEVIACGFRATAKGNFIGPPVGDPWMMPGVFMVVGNKLMKNHQFRHAGDHPDFKEFAKVILPQSVH